MFLIRSGDGTEISIYLENERKPKLSYTRNVINHIYVYDIQQFFTVLPPKQQQMPPWKDTAVDITLSSLPDRKSLYAPAVLKCMFANAIDKLPKYNNTHIYCDGSVSEAGRAGCGAIVREHSDGSPKECHYALRLSDCISSTHAELHGIRL